MNYIFKYDPEMAKIFSDKTRQRILELLAKEEMTNSLLAAELGLSKPTLSYQLKILIEANIVKISRLENESHGIQMKYYCLNPELINIPGDKKISDETKEMIFQNLFEDSKNEFNNEIPLVFLRLLKSSIVESGIEFDRPMYNSGYELGKSVFSKKIKSSDFNSVIKEIGGIWSNLNLGKVEMIGQNMIRVRDCYQCHNMPDVGTTLCPTDEGIIAGILDTVLGKSYTVKETKCWGTGHDFCEFEIFQNK